MVRSKQLVTLVSRKTGYTKQDVKKIIDGLFLTTLDLLEEGEEVYYYRLGSFQLTRRESKISQNPSNGEPVFCDPYIAVNFVVARELKNMIKRRINPNKFTCPVNTKKNKK